MLDNLRRDASRLSGRSRRGAPWYWLEALAFDNGFQAVVLYRCASWFRRHRIPLLGPAVTRLSTFLTGAEISHAASIGPGLRVSHGVGLVVGGSVEIGVDALLLHGVTLGSPSEGRVEEMPKLGDRVFVGAGATLVGAIAVGDDAVIGAGAVITEGVPPGSRVTVRQELVVSPRGERLAPPPESDD